MKSSVRYNIVFFFLCSGFHLPEHCPVVCWLMWQSGAGAAMIATEIVIDIEYIGKQGLGGSEVIKRTRRWTRREYRTV